MEAHAQLPPTISADQSELSFEIAESSVLHDERTDGTNESLSDVQLEPTTVTEDRTSSIATDLPCRHLAVEGKAINTINAKS